MDSLHVWVVKRDSALSTGLKWRSCNETGIGRIVAQASPAVPCTEGSTARWGACSLKNGTVMTPCDLPGDRCVRRFGWFGQCRPESSELPGPWDTEFLIEELTCSSPVELAPEEEPSPGEGEVAVQAVAIHPLPETCGTFSNGTTESCGDLCFLCPPVSGLTSSLPCQAVCEIISSCHCALFDAAAGTCRLAWTPCNSALLGLKPANANQPSLTAFAPCSSAEATVELPQAVSNAHGDCKPFKLYPGVVVVPGPRGGCRRFNCAATPLPAAASLDACLQACTTAGFDVCASVSWTPHVNDTARCTAYSVMVEYMGAHATERVLADNGLDAVTASYCFPPEGERDMERLQVSPEIPDFGLSWSDICDNHKGDGLAIVVGLQPRCTTMPACLAKQPAGRHNRSYGAEGRYYESMGVSECEADCLATPECGCAFYRPGGGCFLSSAPCDDPELGAVISLHRESTAMFKCGSTIPPKVEVNLPETGRTDVDWYGIWDDVCEGTCEFTWKGMNSFCGPECVVPGTFTTLRGSAEECGEVCKSIDGCGCAFFESSSGRCSLQGDKDGKIETWDTGACPGVLFYDTNYEDSENDVVELCPDGFQCGGTDYDYLY